MFNSEFQFTTQKREEFVDITEEIRAELKKSSVKNGIVTVFVPHTTAAVTINENADPDVQHDIIKALNDISPKSKSYFRHGEGNSDAHVKSSLVGPSLQVIVQNGVLKLGTWQGIYFCEFDGPRSRKVYLQVM